MGINYTNLYFPVCSLIIAIFIFILFFSKKKIKNEETNNYSSLVVLSLIEAFLYTYICLSAHFFLKDNTIWIFEILNKIIYIVYILWFTTLFKYVLNIIKPKKNKLINKIILGFNVVVCLLISMLKVEIFYDAATGLSNSYGPSSNMLYLGISVYLLVMTTISIVKIKDVEYRSKFIPIYVLGIFMLIGLIIRKVNPFINISSNTLSFVCLVMFFTIENPDIKIVDELIKNNKLLERSFEDKTIYLFELSNQLKEPTNKLNKIVHDLNNNQDMENDKLIMEIDENTRLLKSIINDNLNISSNDVNNIKINNTTYNLPIFLTDIKKKTELKLKDKDIDLQFNINTKIPEMLYGDSVKLKQVIISLITNAIKYTKSGLITISISCINRYDVCRLIIKIKDTGKPCWLAATTRSMPLRQVKTRSKKV